MDRLIAITAALSDPNRLRALLAVRRGGELCLCQITELLQLAPSTVSKHLWVLKQAGLLQARKQARWMFYQIPPHAQLGPQARSAIRWVCSALEQDPAAAADSRRLADILQQDPQEICKRQNQKRACCSSAPPTPAAARWPKDGRAALKAT